MAINDVSLTAGMRSNLTSLQATVDLLNRTQDRLSTGKKVNTALDNPLNYFTAKTLNSRASDLAGYKDAMSEAVQTIKAGNAGITAIEGLISQAKAVAASAKSTAEGASTAYAVEVLTFSGITSGAVITVGGVGFTATTCGTIAQCAANPFFFIGATANDVTAAQNFAARIGMYASVAACSTAICDILVDSLSGAAVTLSMATTSVVTGTILICTTQVGSESILAGSATDRANYYSQYVSIRDQIDLVANDSSYKGINFLVSGTSLDVFFGTTSTDKIAILGFDASSGGDSGLTGLQLTMSSAWINNTFIDTDVIAMTAAENTLKAQTSNLSSGLSIINVRQDWVKGMVNTLTEGADKLTLADMNEEGANMLMLQTRQTLGTTALSLSAQAAQSVLRLFA